MLKIASKKFDPCFDSRDAEVVKVSGSRDARKDSSSVGNNKAQACGERCEGGLSFEELEKFCHL